MRYKGDWWGGCDIALISIPQVTPTYTETIFDIWKSWTQPTTCAIVGFPCIKKHGKTYSHHPSVSSVKGDDICQIQNNNTTIRYFCETSPGMSGGAVQLDDTIVGALFASLKFGFTAD